MPSLLKYPQFILFVPGGNSTVGARVRQLGIHFVILLTSVHLRGRNSVIQEINFKLMKASFIN